jgi:hypothetical protein
VASLSLILDLHISTELPHMADVPEAEAAEQEVAVDTEALAASPEGWFSQFLLISRAIINCGDFDFGCVGVHTDGGARGDLH